MTSLISEVEAEEPVRQPQRLAGVAQRRHAADEIWTAASNDHVERRRTVPAHMLAQCVGDRSKGHENVGIVRLAADQEQDIALLQPVLEADARDLLHLLVGRIAAKIGGDDRVVAEHLGDQRVRAAAEGRREDRPGRIDHIDVTLALIGAQLVDLLLEVGIVDREEVRRQIEALPTRIVPVKAAFEIAGDGDEAAALGAHPDRIELQCRDAEIVVELPKFGELLHQR